MKLATVLTVLSLVVTGATLTGCPDDPIAPGSIVAKFTLFPSDCDTLRLSQIRARVLASDGTILNEASVPCQTNGEITVDTIPPGTYTVVIDGLSNAPQPQATHAARIEAVRVTEGGTTTTTEELLTQKPGSVHVRWFFSDNLECIDNGITQIEVKLLDTGNNTIGERTVPCDGNSFLDLEEDPPATKSGLLFEDIKVQTFNVVVRGFETVGGSATRQGVESNITLGAGDREQVNVTLEPVTP